MLVAIRRHILFIATAACFCAAAQAQSVAFTFDDGPRTEQTPLMSPQQRNQAMLDALAAHKVSAALFVTCGFGATQPDGYALAKAWGDAGHALGNHTMTHPDLAAPQVTLALYQQELLDCDRITSTLPGYQKWFRFTFLREGNTPEKRDGMRGFLKQHGYRNGYVSLDTSDWRLDEKLNEVLRANPKADIAPIKQAYLAHVKQRALAYRDLSRKLEGRDIPQVMLQHHNLLNALWLKDVIEQFVDMGWTIVTPAQAFADPVYQLQPDRPAPGQSLLLSIARTRGMGKFEGWERLVDDGDFEIDQLKKSESAPQPLGLIDHMPEVDVKAMQGRLDPAISKAVAETQKSEGPTPPYYQSSPAFHSANSDTMTAAFTEAKVPDCLHSEGLKRQPTFFLTGYLALPFIAIAKLRGKCI